MLFCIGNVIIGSVEGSRIAGKSLKNKLAKVEVRRSPKRQSKLIGQCHSSGHRIAVCCCSASPAVKFKCTTPNSTSSFVSRKHQRFHNGTIRVHLFQTTIQIFCIREGVASAEIAGIEWYDGSNGLMSANCRSLAICYENGAMQLMTREDDPTPMILDVDLHVVSLKWNDNGSLLAVAGFQSAGDKTHNFVHFYSPCGEVR